MMGAGHTDTKLCKHTLSVNPPYPFSQSSLDFFFASHLVLLSLTSDMCGLTLLLADSAEVVYLVETGRTHKLDDEMLQLNPSILTKQRFHMDIINGTLQEAGKVRKSNIMFLKMQYKFNWFIGNMCQGLTTCRMLGVNFRLSLFTFLRGCIQVESELLSGKEGLRQLTAIITVSGFRTEMICLRRDSFVIRIGALQTNNAHHSHNRSKCSPNGKDQTGKAGSMTCTGSGKDLDEPSNMSDKISFAKSKTDLQRRIL